MTLPCTIAPDGRSMICARCGMLSDNPSNVRNRYCDTCKTFLNDPDDPLTACVLYIFRPDRTVPDIVNSRLPKRPDYQVIKTLMLPIIEGAEYPEHVSVLFQDRSTDMFVDETGVLKGLPRNEVATAIYRTAWLKAHPNGNPESLPHIAGIAVVTGRRIWF